MINKNDGLLIAFSVDISFLFTSTFREVWKVEKSVFILSHNFQWRWYDGD